MKQNCVTLQREKEGRQGNNKTVLYLLLHQFNSTGCARFLMRYVVEMFTHVLKEPGGAIFARPPDVVVTEVVGEDSCTEVRLGEFLQKTLP